MNGNRRYWKSYAKEFLQGKWGIAVIGMMAAPLMNTIGMAVAGSLFPGTAFLSWILGEIFLLIVSLLSMIVSTGYNYMLLNMARGREYKISDLFCMFRKGSDGILVAGFIISLFDTVLMIPFYYLSNTTAPKGTTIEALYEWMLPVMVCMFVGMLLGVVIKLPFSMAFYILADEPQLKGTRALKKSAELMKGHMWKFFLLQLSFVPMILLSVVTFYIALIWIMPYMQASMTAFYMDVTGELEERRRKHAQEMARWTPEVLGLTGENGTSKEMQEPEAHRTGDDYDAEA